MSDYSSTKRTTTEHETPFKCPYGCGKDIAKTKVTIKLPNYSGELVPYLELSMHYEMTEDGDLGHIHVCKRFQKLIDIDDRLENIEAAKKLNFKTIHLLDPNTIEEQIKNFIN